MASNVSCPRCEGSGWILVSTERGSVAKRCECFEKELEVARYDAYGLPARLTRHSFDNFRAGHPSKEKAKYDALTRAMRVAKDFADAFPLCDRKGLLFHGSSATEMTHLAVATLKLLIAKGLSCLYYDYQLLIERLQQRQDPDLALAEASRVLGRKVLDVDVLLIDSLGEHRATAWTVDTISKIIKHRYYHEKCLLVTTGLPLQSVAPQYPDGYMYQRLPPQVADALGNRIGEESVSRLRDHCEDISMARDEADRPEGAAVRKSR